MRHSSLRKIRREKFVERNLNRQNVSAWWFGVCLTVVIKTRFSKKLKFTVQKSMSWITHLKTFIYRQIINSKLTCNGTLKYKLVIANNVLFYLIFCSLLRGQKKVKRLTRKKVTWSFIVRLHHKSLPSVLWGLKR